jgi:hypothetical protein
MRQASRTKPRKLWDSDPTSPGLFSGEGGTGKSLLELAKDVAHVTGKDWLGSLPALGPAFYIGAEDDEKELHIRLAAIAKHYQVTFEELVHSGLHVAIAKHYQVTFEELVHSGLHVLCLLGQDATLCAATGKSGKVQVTELYRQLYEQAWRPTGSRTFGGDVVPSGRDRSRCRRRTLCRFEKTPVI